MNMIENVKDEFGFKVVQKYENESRLKMDFGQMVDFGQVVDQKANS